MLTCIEPRIAAIGKVVFISTFGHLKANRCHVLCADRNAAGDGSVVSRLMPGIHKRDIGGVAYVNYSERF